MTGTLRRADLRLRAEQKEFPDQFGFCVSHTTRMPRPGETAGVHYHFTDRETIAAQIAEGAQGGRRPRRHT